MIQTVDVVFGLSWGEEAKGKVVSCLAEKGNKGLEYNYDWVCRWSGGSNAGHTIYHNDKKYVTHLVPSGIFHGIKCYIGPDCFVNINELLEELNYLKDDGFDTSLIYISPNAHVVRAQHIFEDIQGYKNTQGSTCKGITPCSRDKFARIGLTIKRDMKHRLLLTHNKNMLMECTELSGNLLCEGAQGYWLDINKGNYPYVTSSYTLPYSACSLGFPPQKIREIYGCSKLYDTRVGVDPDFPDRLNADKDLVSIGQVGEEVGATTGRKRRVNWLNLDKLITAINVSGTSIIIFSKIDLLKQVNVYKLYYLQRLHTFEDYETFVDFIQTIISRRCSFVKDVILSDSKFTI